MKNSTVSDHWFRFQVFYWKRGLCWFSHSVSPCPSRCHLLQHLGYRWIYSAMPAFMWVCSIQTQVLMLAQQFSHKAISLALCVIRFLWWSLKQQCVIIPKFLNLEGGCFHHQSQMSQCLWGQHNRTQLESLCRALMKAQRFSRTLSSETWPPSRRLPGELEGKGRNVTGFWKKGTLVM